MEKKKKIIAISLIALLCVALGITISAVSNNEKELDISFKELNEPLLEGKYSTFLENNKNLLANKNEEEILIEAKSFIDSAPNIKYYDSVAAYSLKEDETLTINTEIENAGLYYIELSYYLLADEYGSNEVSVVVNNEVQYDEAKQITLEENWYDAGDYTLDRYENDNLPEQIKDKRMLTAKLRDSSRLYDEGICFALNKGLNEIKINSVQGDVDIVSVKLIKYSEKQSYSTYYSNQEIIKSTLLTYEAEKYSSKNSSSIQAGTSSDSSVTPYNVKRNKLNVIGNDNCNEAGNSLTYNVEVDKEGFYYLTFKALQSEKNTTAYRTIYINGEVPFKEAYTIPFRYTSKWKNITLGGLDGKPFAFKLNKGLNTIKLEVATSKMRIVGEKLTKISTEMNQLGLAITRITGNSTDKEIDWELEEYFTDIHQTFDTWIKELKDIIEYLKFAYGYDGKSYAVSDITTALTNIETLAKDVNKIPTRLTLLSSGSSCASQYLSGQISKVSKSTVAFDKFYVHGKDDKLPKATANAFKNVWNSTRKLVNSFFDENYSAKHDDDAVIVWTARSRQYVNILQKMIDEEFTKETGIKVDVELLADESKLLLANAANNQPDVVTGISTWIPNEYGMRGAICDLRETFKDDYVSAIADFKDEQLIPLIYDDKLFGIPETENFYVLFYRKDILKELNILNDENADKPVDTWDDVIDILPILERFGMQFYIPLSSSSSSKSFDSTAPFIWQFDGTLYNLETLTAGIDNEKTIQALTFMTDLYREYSLPYQISNFFNYFRYGDMPIGIADYGTYLQLLNAAPEISGLWDISVVPGVKNGDTVNRYMSGAQQATMIFDASDKKSDSWEFVKWWTKKETQLRYSQKMVNTYGKKYLWNTANMEAFKELPWNKHDKEVILQQWEYLKEVAKIPGSYIIEREISNIYNSVVFNDANLRSTVSDSVIKMNKEIQRKMIEFGYVDEFGTKIKDYKYPSADRIKEWREGYEG